MGLLLFERIRRKAMPSLTALTAQWHALVTGLAYEATFDNPTTQLNCSYALGNSKLPHKTYRISTRSEPVHRA